MASGIRHLCFLAFTAATFSGAYAQAPATDDAETAAIPEIRREARGVWVATVSNIDWPSRPGLPSDQQQAELLAILDKCVELNLNQVVLQVRPATDALYESELEPWSEYLTGEQGKPPEPFYDPLKFAIEEAHKRGLELHCWFNPYRARLVKKGPQPTAPNHISKTHPDLVKDYGTYQWLDPSRKEVQDHSIAVIMDVVKRYDIDAVHMDDYFYPYKVRDEQGKIVDFPDEDSWQAYKESGGEVSRSDWRRDGVNKFIKRLYDEIKAAKPHVQFGLSPFGIWKPGHPPQIQGLNQFEELYADAKLWLNKGWVDYWTPQLYWPIAKPQQSFPVLLEWWVEQNEQDRHVWPGLYTSRFANDESSTWTTVELQYQIEWTRLQPGATGNTHFSMKPLMRNTGGVTDLLKKTVYSDKALVPASPWLDDDPPAAPTLEVADDSTTGTGGISWNAGGDEPAWLWAVYLKGRDSAGKEKWSTDVLPREQTSLNFEDTDTTAPELVAVSAIDRNGNESRKAIKVLEGLGVE